MAIFKENVETVRHHNSLFDLGESTFRMSINQFADMTFEEFSTANEPTIVLPDNVPFHPAFFERDYNVEIPSSFDWRDLGIVSKVKDQKSCGSCYAMAALDAIESQILIKSGKDVSLSVQEVVDCAGEFETWGCSGGLSHRVIDYVKSNSGISSSRSYPYQEKRNACESSRYPKILISLNGFGILGDIDEEMLKIAVVQIGPIAVSIDIDHESFMRYSGGIYKEPNCSQTYSNHATIVVGFGNENNEDYWILKNSFGEKWGEKGYMRIARNFENHCAIASQPFYPIIN